jgi:putative heme transporter
VVSTASIVRIVVAAFLVWLLVKLWPVVLVIVIALMIVGALTPLVAALERRNVGRLPAVALVFGALAAALAGLVALVAPQLVAEGTDLVERFPRLQSETATLLERWRATASLASTVRNAQLTTIVGETTHFFLSYSTRAAEVLAYGATCVVVALYLMIDRDRMRGALFSLVPRAYHVRFSRVLLNLTAIVGGYVRGQLITSVLMTAFTFVVLEIARVPNALALSVFAGLTDVLPYVGGLLACGPATFAAYGAHGLPSAIATLVALGAYQEFESRVIVPRVYGRALRLPSAVVVIALLAGGTLLGILGALLALPIAAGIRMVVEELRLELPGEGAHDPTALAEDAREERVFQNLAGDAPAQEAAAVATEIAQRRIAHDAAAGADPTKTPVSTDPVPRTR